RNRKIGVAGRSPEIHATQGLAGNVSLQPQRTCTRQVLRGRVDARASRRRLASSQNYREEQTKEHRVTPTTRLVHWSASIGFANAKNSTANAGSDKESCRT